MKLASAVIGTAGHIDHGKTSLVKALTGTDTDSLAEEKRRGITIDLGFARLPLGEGEYAGIVDVPGHLRFIRNMLAGVSSVDFALLVIAADDSIMPQTIEHLAILELLNTRGAVVALTKADLVDDETLELAWMEIEELLSSSSPALAGAKIIPCSSVTGTGVEEVREALANLAKTKRAEKKRGFFKMPLDRVFNVKGHGLVVTGSVACGTVKTGDKVILLPGNIETRVRRIQNHGETCGLAEAGTRTALNLSVSGRGDVARGMMVLHPAIATESKVFTAEVVCHQSSPFVISHGQSYLLNIHTTETICRVFLATEKSIKPGERCVAQIRFKNPLCIHHADKFILRSSSAKNTLGGGTVLEPSSRMMGRRGLKTNVKKWEALKKGTDHGLLAIITEHPFGVSLKHITTFFNLLPKEIDELIKTQGDVKKFEWGGTAYICLKSEGEKIVKDIVTAVAEHHNKNPDSPGIEESSLAKICAPNLDCEELARYWVSHASTIGVIELDGAYARLPGRNAVFAGKDEAIRKKILDLFKNALFAPPKTDKTHITLGLEREKVARAIRDLIKTGELVSLTPDYLLHKDTLESAKEALINGIKTQGAIDTASYRNILGTGRKTAIEILEYFDAIGLTERIDNKGQRVLSGRPDE